MKKEVLVEVEGVQKDESGQENVIHYTCDGIYSVIDGKNYLVYEEQMDGADEKTQNLVSIGISEVTVTKRGAVETKMEFCSGKRKNFSYITIYGKMYLESFTRNLMIKSDDKSILIVIDYDLELGGDLISECRIKIKATTKE